MLYWFQFVTQIQPDESEMGRLLGNLATRVGIWPTELIMFLRLLEVGASD